MFHVPFGVCGLTHRLSNRLYRRAGLRSLSSFVDWRCVWALTNANFCGHESDKECVELISAGKFCFGDSSNKTEFDTRERLLALWSRLAMVTICFAVKKQTLKTLFPSATCGCERAVSGKGRIVDCFCWFIPHAHIQSLSLCSSSQKRHRKQSSTSLFHQKMQQKKVSQQAAELTRTIRLKSAEFFFVVLQATLEVLFDNLRTWFNLGACRETPLLHV